MVIVAFVDHRYLRGHCVKFKAIIIKHRSECYVTLEIYAAGGYNMP